MAFKIQDLMTDILPEPTRWVSCSGGTTCRGAAGLFAAGSKGGGQEKSPKCPPASRGDGPPKPNPKPRPPADYADYADLVLLQRQLRQTLSAQM